MRYKCDTCRKTFDEKQVRYVLKEKQPNKPRVHVCMNCHTSGIKKAAKETSKSFLPGAKLGM